MSNLVLEWSEIELLATDEVAEPLVAAGVKCHGGYKSDGRYVSPRTKFRVPAIQAWQQSHREQFGTQILESPLAQWPDAYPSVAQTKFLLREGVAAPTITTLTRIGTVEGFGSVIRQVDVGDMQQYFDESIAGTALAHLQRGLFEAHARDEAGFEEEAGHKQMWFSARDIAFEEPPTEDMTQAMLVRMGVMSADGKPPTPEQARANQEAIRRFPDIPLAFEMMLWRMINLLFIEVSAFHTFAWAEEVLSDDALVAGSGEAAEIVRCIRADETPHVDYLRTALTEVRDRRLVGAAGARVAGSEVIGTIWDRLIEQSSANHDGFVKTATAEVEHALASNPRKSEILDGFHAIGTEAHSSEKGRPA